MDSGYRTRLGAIRHESMRDLSRLRPAKLAGSTNVPHSRRRPTGGFEMQRRCRCLSPLGRRRRFVPAPSGVIRIREARASCVAVVAILTRGGPAVAARGMSAMALNLALQQRDVVISAFGSVHDDHRYFVLDVPSRQADWRCPSVESGQLIRGYRLGQHVRLRGHVAAFTVDSD